LVAARHAGCGWGDDAPQEFVSLSAHEAIAPARAGHTYSEALGNRSRATMAQIPQANNQVFELFADQDALAPGLALRSWATIGSSI